jgi:gamma-carbonic anhydrase
MNPLIQLTEQQLDTFRRKSPRIDPTAYVARGAVVVGDVTLGERSSVWYNAVLRGDINYIRVGKYTNIQDNAVIHLAELYPTLIGDYVTIGHSAIVHACTVGNETLIGMAAVVLDGAVIGNRCLIGAKALVTQGTQIPDGSLVLGAPAKVVRKLEEKDFVLLRESAEKYAANAAYCLQNNWA